MKKIAKLFSVFALVFVVLLLASCGDSSSSNNQGNNNNGNSNDAITTLSVTAPSEEVREGNEFTVGAGAYPTNSKSTSVVMGLEWTVSDTSIAAKKQNLTYGATFTALKAGTVTITAKTTDGSKLEKSVTITVVSDYQVQLTTSTMGISSNVSAKQTSYTAGDVTYPIYIHNVGCSGNSFKFLNNDYTSNGFSDNASYIMIGNLSRDNSSSASSIRITLKSKTSSTGKFFKASLYGWGSNERNGIKYGNNNGYNAIEFTASDLATRKLNTYPRVQAIVISPDTLGVDVEIVKIEIKIGE